MANEFKYESTYKGWNGRIVYVCKCSRCGNECEYNRKVGNAPVCTDCRKKQESDRVKRKLNSKYDDVRNNTIDEAIDVIHKYFCEAIDNGADVFSKEDKDMLTYNKHICDRLKELKVIANA